jgi:hypothetical protein
MKNKEQKKYYKVVYEHYNSMKSANFSNIGYNTTQYKLNEWTVAPKNTRLFVFDNLAEAKVYAGKKLFYHIYECKIVGGIRGAGSNFTDNDRINRYWKVFNKELKKKKKFNVYDVMRKNGILLAFYSAVLTKKVKLIKKVQ